VEAGLLVLRQRVEIEDLVVESDHLPAVGQEVPAADDALRVGGGRPVEGLGGRRPPVDEQRFVVGGRQPEAADVVAGALAHVEAPEAEGKVADVEGRQAVLEVRGQGVTLLTPLVGAARRTPDPAELVAQLRPHLVEPGVEPLDIGALGLEIAGTGAGRSPGIRFGHSHLLGPAENPN